jgi:V/A-type H+-transporting ATPase subunit I
MKAITAIGVTSSLDKVVKVFGRSEAFEPVNALSFYERSENIEKFSSLNEENIYISLLKSMEDLANEANLDLKLVDISRFFPSTSDIEEFVEYSKENLGSYLVRKKKINQKISYFKKAITEISMFTEKNIDLDEIYACEYFKARFGKLPIDAFRKASEEFLLSDYVLFCVFSKNKLGCWGVYFSPVDHLEEVDKIFKTMGFEELKDFGTKGTPETRLHEIKEEISKLKKERQFIEECISKFLKINNTRFLKFYTKLVELKNFFDIKNNAFKYGENFILAGWVLENRSKILKSNLKRIEGVEVSIENANDVKNHEPPVQIKNRGFFKPFEVFVRMYGMPKYDSIDPTPLFAITFTLMFGAMFGDLGQGLVISAIGIFLIKKLKKLDFGKILVYCGLSSTFFGMLYGSVFGFEKALNGFYHAVFNFEEKPIDVVERSDSMTTMLLVSIGLGCVMLLISMCINVFSSIRKKDFETAFFSGNGICGIVFYFSVVTAIATLIFLSLNLFSPIFIFFLLVLPLLCIFFHKPLDILIFKKGSFKDIKFIDYFIENLLELLFETILGYISSTMSFLRIAIYVLVHSVMMQVVFSLAKDLPFVGFVIVAILGNIVIMVIEGVLAGIQAMRLEFYEMFNRFFGDQAKSFKPVMAKN